MDRDILKEWIEQNLFRSDGALSSKKCKKEWFFRYGELDKYDSITDYTAFLDDGVQFSERLFYIMNDLENVVVCDYQECSEKPSFDSFSMGYRDFCSQECAQRSERTKERSKETLEEKYGVEHHLQKEEFLKKRRQTVRENYGVDNVSQAEEIKRKKKETTRENFGVDFPMQSSKVREKSIQASIDNYGVDNVMKSEEIKEKARDTRIKKEIKRILNSDRFTDQVKPLFNIEEYDGINREYRFKCLKCGDIFTDNLRKGKVPRCYNCYPSQNTSKAEKEVYYFLDELLDCEVQNNTWDVIDDQELDIYIPEKNLAVEYNGLFYHSENNGGCGKNYHLNKTEKCEEQDIQLIHIFGDEWIEKQPIVKDRLRHILGCYSGDSVYARNCEVKEIDVGRKNDFLRTHHLQGDDKSRIKLGAFYGDDLVAVMTFSLPRISLGRSNNEDKNFFEISRFSVGNKMVVGVAGKLLSYFENNWRVDKIFTFADRRWSTPPTVYDNLGFKLDLVTEPSYWYIKNGTRYHRFTFRKDVLSEKFEEFDSELTEWQNMQLNGYDRIWDCGNFRYKKEY